MGRNTGERGREGGCKAGEDTGRETVCRGEIGGVAVLREDAREGYSPRQGEGSRSRRV